MKSKVNRPRSDIDNSATQSFPSRHNRMFFKLASPPPQSWSKPYPVGLRAVAALAAVVTLLVVWPSRGQTLQEKPAMDKARKKAATPPTEDLFTNTQPFHIQIEIPEAGIQILRGTQSSPWNASGEKRPTVKCTVREGNQVYTDVAVHLKGAAGSFRPVDAEPAFTLHFDKYVQKQSFHGLKRLSLNNSVQDPSLLSERICREMFAAAGVPVPRAAHARVGLNGRDLGVYVLTEAFNKQFLARHFQNPDGNLYDGGFLKDVTDPLEKSSGPNPDDRSDLKRLAEAALDPNPASRLARLDRVLDLNRFITLLALDVMMCDWDGYAINKNNYRIYHDPDSDKIVFMPHGLDQMFGVMRAQPDMPIYPRMNGLVAIAVMQIPESRQLYQERLSQLLTNVFNVEALTNRAWQLAAAIRPELPERGHNSAQRYDREVGWLCERIGQRARSIQEQLNAPDSSLKFNSAGVALLSGWKSRADSGKPVLDETTDATGKKLLHVSAAKGSCVGTWFTKVRLDPGRYRFRGRAKCRGVVSDPGDTKAGAGLRDSNHRFIQKLSGDGDWTDVSFDVDLGQVSSQFGFMAPVESGIPEVELICQLRAARGEAWFDPDSLHLVRE